MVQTLASDDHFYCPTPKPTVQISFSLGLDREALLKALNPASPPRMIIDELKKNPRLHVLFEHPTGVDEGYSVEEHTEFVLSQADRYGMKWTKASPMTPECFRLVLALHDIGIGLGTSKTGHAARSVEVLRAIRHAAPVDDAAFEIGCDLVNQDWIGRLIKGSITGAPTLEERRALGNLSRQRVLDRTELSAFQKRVEVSLPVPGEDRFEKFAELRSAAADWVLDASRVHRIAPGRLLTLMRSFYQSDTAAYTYDAQLSNGRRALPGLEFLYKIDTSWKPAGTKDGIRYILHCRRGGGLEFNSEVNRIFLSLVREVRERVRAQPSSSCSLAPDSPSH